MIKFEIKNRCSGAAQFTAEIDCAEDALRSVKIGLAVKWGVKSMADLRVADLSGADLRGAPKIENIHKAIYAAASADGALNMGKWHTCETTHCRAGWAVHLAGEEGRALEENIGTAAAGALIYIASDPTLERVPNWYASNDEALADMKALAEKEPA
jgi:hypothetical protein